MHGRWLAFILVCREEEGGSGKRDENAQLILDENRLGQETCPGKRETVGLKSCRDLLFLSGNKALVFSQFKYFDKAIINMAEET